MPTYLIFVKIIFAVEQFFGNSERNDLSYKRCILLFNLRRKAKDRVSLSMFQLKFLFCYVRIIIMLYKKIKKSLILSQ